jgi:hypothetical protein
MSLPDNVPAAKEPPWTLDELLDDAAAFEDGGIAAAFEQHLMSIEEFEAYAEYLLNGVGGNVTGAAA